MILQVFCSVLRSKLCNKIVNTISSLNYDKIFTVPKMGKEEILKRISQNSTRGEELVKFIEQQIPLLRRAAAENQEKKLVKEVLERNVQLKIELELWKNRVVELEVMNGIQQYSLPDKETKLNTAVFDSHPNKSVSDVKGGTSNTQQDSNHEGPKSEPTQHSKKESLKGDKKEKSNTKSSKSDRPPPSEENKEINVSRLDLRIGRILSAKKHPDAESLYVEEIDVGEEKPRTVVSGLVNYVPLKEMQNRLVVVLCNLKPAKMRGVTSEAMVMCASTPDKVEILCPPIDSAPGDRVICDEYPGLPDPLLPPKKKIFEQVAPDLKTNAECVATYKAALLKIAGKGVIKSATLTNVQIK